MQAEDNAEILSVSDNETISHEIEIYESVKTPEEKIKEDINKKLITYTTEGKIYDTSTIINSDNLTAYLKLSVNTPLFFPVLMIIQSAIYTERIIDFTITKDEIEELVYEITRINDYENHRNLRFFYELILFSLINGNTIDEVNVVYFGKLYSLFYDTKDKTFDNYYEEFYDYLIKTGVITDRIELTYGKSLAKYEKHLKRNFNHEDDYDN